MNNTTSDCISFVETDKMDEYIEIVTRQTGYTIDEARQKLSENNYNYIYVIKDYMGVTEKNEPKQKSVNQEIYAQMRIKLNSALDKYNAIKEEEQEKNRITK
jgi:hypothetical protein